LDYLAADLYSKALTVAVAGHSRPFKPGIGALFIEAARGRWPLAAPALAIAVAYSPAAAAAAATASLLLFLALYRHLGGANGDVFGALLEASRAAYLYALGRVVLTQS
jgi:adenosylcobinamide-GDP ribazoletransferase